MIGNCDTCIKFRHECPNGVQETPDDGIPTWDGHDGGCSLFLGNQCKQCRNLHTDNGRRNCGIDAGWMARMNDGGCEKFAPKVAQATLEGF